MWKPTNVVQEHKKRATVVWGILLLAIVGYTAWQIAKLAGKFDNPSTNFSVSDDVYEFPRLDICVWGGKGCDESLDDTRCIESATINVFDPCFNETLGANTTSEWTNCVAVDLSGVDMKGFEDGCEPSKKPSVLVTMMWLTSIAPDEEEYFRDVVGVFLGNESPPEYVMVPYTRVVTSAGVPAGDVTYIEADMTIGKSTRNYFGSDSITSYPVLSVSTNDYVDQTPDSSGTLSGNGSFALGYLQLTLTQGGYSLTELTDIDPLDIGALLGNIGGFWELLLVTWGLCFIAARTEAPTERGRDFTQPVKKGQDIVSRKRRRSSSQSTSPDSEGGAEERSCWDTSGRNARDASGSSFRDIPPVGARPPAVVAASAFRRPIQQDYPTRSVSNSSRSLVTGKSFMATGGGEVSAIAQAQPPAYSDCA